MEIYGWSSHPGQTEGKSFADQYDYRYYQEQVFNKINVTVFFKIKNMDCIPHSNVP